MAHTPTAAGAPPPATTFKPYVPPTDSPAEFTAKAVVLGVVFAALAAVLARAGQQKLE